MLKLQQQKRFERREWRSLTELSASIFLPLIKLVNLSTFLQQWSHCHICVKINTESCVNLVSGNKKWFLESGERVGGREQWKRNWWISTFVPSQRCTTQTLSLLHCELFLLNIFALSAFCTWSSTCISLPQVPELCVICKKHHLELIHV